jgi:hypothetical protein
MRGSERDVDPLEALIQKRKVTWVLPPALRERVLARAQSTVATSAGIPRLVPVARPTMERAALASPPPSRSSGLLRMAMAASIALVMGAVGAVAALRTRTAPALERAHVPAAVPASVVAVAARPAPAAAADSAVMFPPAVTTRPSGDPDPFTAEMRLLRRAQGAYAHQDFSTALTVLAEHGRRFPRGHLAEEREALRVRSLLGSGRAADAHRAAAAFTARFPRSVLLPRLEAQPEAGK